MNKIILAAVALTAGMATSAWAEMTVGVSWSNFQEERWKTDAKTLDTMRNELAQVQDTLARERERRESAEADALRANARLEALEPLLNQLTPAQNAVKKTRRGHAQDGGAD